MSIKVHCRTNLDEHQKEYWPRMISCRPLVGDKIRSSSGRTLRVVAIIHSEKQSGEPYLELELHN